jgi:hypothetical protein
MRELRFSKLYLLSGREQRALKLSFPTRRTVIKGGNGFGKSAVLKSLYDTFGAEPHKIDQAWKSATVHSAVEFAYLGDTYFAVKALGLYGLFDANKRLMFDGVSKVKEWGPKLAEFLGFHLEMNDRQGRSVVPPPAYIFAPFYVDQDKGWGAPWSSFKDFYLRNSPKVLAEYHSGLRPDEYYVARAEQERARVALLELEHSRRALRETLAGVRAITEAAGVTYDVAVFEREVADLLRETATLRDAQQQYRRKLADLHEEQHIWEAERSLLMSTLAEMRGELAETASWPDEVECPTCGQHYSHALADRFSLIADQTVLSEALANADARFEEVRSRTAEERAGLQGVLEALQRIEATLARKQHEISFRDVVVAEGKTEAAKIIGASLDQKEEEALRLMRASEEQRRLMNDAIDSARIKKINASFRGRLVRNAAALDVRLENPERQQISSVRVARGSEGPRGLLAYYYGFLHTKAEFGDGVWCPIVMDAPNQQGQDNVHLPQLLEFILSNAPQQAQVIVATEHFDLPVPDGVAIQDVGVRKHQVLNDADYDEVSAFFEPFEAVLREASR